MKDPLRELYYAFFGPLTLVMVLLNALLLWSWKDQAVPEDVALMAILFFGTVYGLITYSRFKLFLYERELRKRKTKITL